MGYEEDAEIARLLHRYIRKAQRAHLPRYTGGGRQKNTINMWVKPSFPDTLQFSISHDIVTQWYNWMMHDMTGRFSLRRDMDLRMHFVNFRYKSIPIVVFKLEDGPIPPVGNKLTQRPKTWQFRCQVRASKIGIDPDAGNLKPVEIVPWPAIAGHCLIFPRSHRVYQRRYDDPYPILKQLIDPNEPPRFRHGVRDPNYHPEQIENS